MLERMQMLQASGSLLSFERCSIVEGCSDCDMTTPDSLEVSGECCILALPSFQHAESVSCGQASCCRTSHLGGS